MEGEVPAELWRTKDRFTPDTNGDMKVLYEGLRPTQEQAKHPVVSRTHLRRRVGPAKS